MFVLMLPHDSRSNEIKRQSHIYQRASMAEDADWTVESGGKLLIKDNTHAL